MSLLMSEMPRSRARRSEYDVPLDLMLTFLDDELELDMVDDDDCLILVIDCLTTLVDDVELADVDAEKLELLDDENEETDWLACCCC